MTDSITITGLALNIFYKNYYKIKQIPLIDRLEVFNFIKQGYYGGITEVYKPHGFNLKYIDINSLYPFVALKPMPGLECQFIHSFTAQWAQEGLDLNNLFGFFETEVEFYGPMGTDNKNKEASYLGLLPTHEKGSLVLPQGKFKGV